MSTGEAGVDHRLDHVLTDDAPTRTGHRVREHRYPAGLPDETDGGDDVRGVVGDEVRRPGRQDPSFVYYKGEIGNFQGFTHAMVGN